MDLLQFNIPEWFFVALNLGVLVYVLKRIFWVPINKILDARQEAAVKAEKDRQEAEMFRADSEQILTQTNQEAAGRAAQLLTEARTNAGREYDRIIAEAEEQSRLINQAAKAKAEQEFEKIMAEAKKQVTSMALEAASVLLKENMDSQRNEKLVKAYLAERDASV